MSYTDDIDTGFPSPVDGDDAFDGPAVLERQPFRPNYTPQAGVRILRSRLYADEGGVAQVIFRGTLQNPDGIWIEQGTSGRLSVYAEVTADPDTDTVLQIALVPTGKRVPFAADGTSARRLGGRKGTHAYLLDQTTQAAPVLPLADEDAEDDGSATV